MPPFLPGVLLPRHYLNDRTDPDSLYADNRSDASVPLYVSPDAPYGILQVFVQTPAAPPCLHSSSSWSTRFCYPGNMHYYCPAGNLVLHPLREATALPAQRKPWTTPYTSVFFGVPSHIFLKSFPPCHNWYWNYNLNRPHFLRHSPHCVSHNRKKDLLT